jgi:16S rRNA (cytidine1402-2'-O)-methyltransferase
VSGALVLVGTPIGNLGDLSPRAVDALTAAAVIACEDTRRTGRLLVHAGITERRLVMLNEHNEVERGAELVDRMSAGETVALVTDAGMPAISDPGERLVAAAVRAGLAVEVVPGPSAGITALAVSGLPTGRFVFEGFLPRKGSARARRLADLAEEARTIVLYEAPHRLQRTLGDLADALGRDRGVVVARELTKLHEELWRGTLGDAQIWAENPRGEIVIVVAGAPDPEPPDDQALVAALEARLAAGASKRDAVDAVSGETGISRRRVYELANSLDGRELRS